MPSRTSCRSGHSPSVAAWRRLLDAAAAFVLEPYCAACHRPLASPTGGCLCGACLDAIPRIAPPACRRCGAPRPVARLACTQCDARWHLIAAAVALGEHEGSLREILHAFKYGRRTSIGAILADALRDPARHVLDGADAVVPVPLHAWRAWWRGFNQARLIAERLGPPVVDALVRRRATSRQSSLARDDRWTNLRAVIGIKPRDAARLRGAVVVLVDDVVTTGATVTACAGVLRAHGVKEVRVVSAARAVRRSPR